MSAPISRRGLLAVVLVGASAWPLALAAQLRSPQAGSARLVAFTNEPLEPELGEVFELRVQVRVAPGVVVFLSDTMAEASHSVSAGAGAWTVTPGALDSVDIRATYPVMGLVPGGVELPLIELWTRPAEAGEAPGVRSSAELPEADRDQADLEYALLYLGGVFVMPPSAMAGDDAVLTPRPPADVLGGDLSPWLLAALALGLGAALTVAWTLVAARAAAPPDTAPPLTPREEALRELDRIRELGWHRNGRLVEFYDATTGVLRHYAERREPTEWRTALTSTELLASLRKRWGAESVQPLDPAVWTAECVKFGDRRPDTQTAEDDWLSVREWIERRGDSS